MTNLKYLFEQKMYTFRTQIFKCVLFPNLFVTSIIKCLFGLKQSSIFDQIDKTYSQVNKTMKLVLYRRCNDAYLRTHSCVLYCTVEY